MSCEKKCFKSFEFSLPISGISFLPLTFNLSNGEARNGYLNAIFQTYEQGKLKANTFIPFGRIKSTVILNEISPKFSALDDKGITSGNF